MFIAVLRFIGICFFLELASRVMNLPGNPRGKPNLPPDSIATVAKLWEEFGDGLPESVYLIFKRAVHFQANGDPQEARNEYLKLAHLCQANGTTYNLFDKSQVLKHNWQLLIKQ
jgi:hypothetical protein